MRGNEKPFADQSSSSRGGTNSGVVQSGFAGNVLTVNSGNSGTLVNLSKLVWVLIDY